MNLFKPDRVRAIDCVIDYFGERAVPPGEGLVPKEGSLLQIQYAATTIFTRLEADVRRLVELTPV